MIKQQQQQFNHRPKQHKNDQHASFMRDKPRCGTLTLEVSREDVFIGETIYNQVRGFCNLKKSSISTVLLGSLLATHFRHTGTEDANIGLLELDVGQTEAEGNLQCIRSTIQDASFETLIQQIKRNAEVTVKNGHLPLERITTDIKSSSGKTHPDSLAQIILVFHSQTDTNQFDLESHEPHFSSSGCEIAFHLWQRGESFQGFVIYVKDLFYSETIKGIISVFSEILQQGINQPDIPIISIPLSGCLSPAQDVTAFHLERESYPRESSLVDVFRRQSRACPTIIAVKDANTELTYAELDEQSDDLSQWLIRRELAPETLVGVLATRSCQTVVVLLGILKAGLAYLPLDTVAPFAWTARLLSSVSGHRLVLVGEKVRMPTEDIKNCQFVSAADALKRVSNGHSSAISHNISEPIATSLAYVMFTSGPDGEPEGVMIEHRGVIRLAKQADITSQLTEGTCIAHTANIAYNASTWEIYSAILNGGTLVCLDDATVSDSARLCDTFVQENIEIASFSPASLEQYLSESPSMFGQLKLLISFGDRLTPQVARKAFLYCPDGDLFNAYGVTENTGLSTCFLVAENDTLLDSVPIGQAVGNSGVVAMDFEQRLVPPGVLGELVLTGDGLARGYLNPEANRGRFINVSDQEGNSIQAYRTGDIVRCRPGDGQLEFIGRMDRQVKILSHRLDLGGVEHELLRNNLVSDAVAFVQGGGIAEAWLTAFVTLLQGDALQDLTSEMKKSGDTGAVNAWTDMYNEAVYTEVGSIAANQLGRDFVGWRSMYDGKHLNEDDMVEWLDDTMSAILNGNPAGHVLEIGTGTGMILFNLGEGLQSYVGLEPVESAVRFVAERATAISHLAGKVDVQVGTAADINSLRELRPQTLVIVNSVAQHFPSSTYLQTMVTDLLLLPAVHQIFFGDIRSFALYDEFLVTMAMHRLGSRFNRTQLRQFIERARGRETELLVDPAFFTGLKSQYQEFIEHVEILPKRVKAKNELSCYRYAAVLHLKRQINEPLQIHDIESDDWVDFMGLGMNYLLLQNYLQQHADSPVIAVSNIPDRRTFFETTIVDSLSSYVEMFDECMLNSDADSHSSLSPDDLVKIAEKTGFRVELSCARQYSQRGSLDAVFHHICPETEGSRVLFNFPADRESQSRPQQSLFSHPQNFQFNRRTERELQASLQKTLPSYMVPALIRILDRIPTTEDQKIDYEALSKLAEMADVDKRV